MQWDVHRNRRRQPDLGRFWFQASVGSRYLSTSITISFCDVIFVVDLICERDMPSHNTRVKQACECDIRLAIIDLNVMEDPMALIIIINNLLLFTERIWCFEHSTFIRLTEFVWYQSLMFFFSSISGMFRCFSTGIFREFYIRTGFHTTINKLNPGELYE